MTPKKPSARKAARDEIYSKYKILNRDTNDSSRLVEMAPRAERRALQDGNFRPVHHHGIPTKIEHKAVIAAMKIHKKGRRAAQSYQQQLGVARAVVSFGLAVKLFLADIALAEMDLRHSTLKASGLWV